MRIRSRLASPFLSEHFVVGTVHGGRLLGELRRDLLGATTGTLHGVSATDDRPIRDYRALGAGDTAGHRLGPDLEPPRLGWLGRFSR